MIDGGVFLGRNPTNGNQLDPSELIDWMDNHGIHRAVIASYRSIFLDYHEGNDEIAAVALRYPERFLPAAVVQPYGFDIDCADVYFARLRASGIRILGIYSTPSYYDLQLESLLVREIARKAVNAGLILQIGLKSILDIHKLGDYYAEIQGPILVRWMCGRAYHAVSEMLNLGRRFRHFYFDIGSLSSSGGIEFLVKKLGAERLYFTSNAPESFPLTSHLLLQTVSLSREEKEQIYHKTLQTLFRLPDDPQDCLKHHFDKDFKAILSHPKIDTHWHTEGWNLIEPEIQPECYKEDFAKFNYKKVIMSSICALNYDLEAGNQALASLIQNNAGYYGLIVIDPTRKEISVKEIHKYSVFDKFVGLKTIQDLYGLKLDDSKYEDLLKLASSFGLPVMAHIPGIDKVADSYPNINFICAHSTLERVKHLLGRPNVFFDIATSHNDWSETNLEALIQKAGEDKILYASDAPLINPAWTLGKLASLLNSSLYLEKIFYKNALKAFPKLMSNGEEILSSPPSCSTKSPT